MRPHQRTHLEKSNNDNPAPDHWQFEAKHRSEVTESRSYGHGFAVYSSVCFCSSSMVSSNATNWSENETLASVEAATQRQRRTVDAAAGTLEDGDGGQ